MCWSFSASIIFTTIGLLASLYMIFKKDDKYLWIPLIYFSLMELLQVFTYLYINQCSLPANQMLTYLGYLHIAFQPFFINMVALHFLPDHIRKKIVDYVYTICFASTILLLIKVYPFAWAETCKVGSVMCGAKLCSMSGSWHLSWTLPFSELGSIFAYAYTIPAFILPLIYGSWRFTLYLFLFGPLLAMSVARSPTEWPAVWCLFSIALLVLVFVPKIRKLFYVNKWYFWNYPKFKKRI